MSRTLLLAGLAQLLATLTPAAHVRVYGNLSFLRLPTANVALVVLGALAIVVAIGPRGWWRWLPGALSATVVAVCYWRLRYAPSATFVDPLLRHAVRPAWGFVPMSAAVLANLVGALQLRR